MNLATNDVWEVRFYCTFGVQTAIPRLHYLISNVAGTPTDIMLADLMDVQFSTEIKGAMVSQASYRGVGVQRMYPLPKTNSVFNIDGQGPGASATTPLPKQISGLIAKKTAFATKNLRGRFYMPFPAEGHSDPDEARPNVGYMAALGALADKMELTLQDTIGPDTYDAFPIIYNGTGARINGSDITYCLTRPYWATQRRRGDFGAANLSPI